MNRSYSPTAATTPETVGRAVISPTRAWTVTDLGMLAVVLIWGSNFSVVKVALLHFSPLAFNAARFGIATILILLIMRLAGESLRLESRDLLPVLFLGLCGHTLYQVLFINGLAYTSPSNASLLMATSPIFVAIYGRILRIERSNRLVWAGIALSFSGIVLVIAGGGAGIHLGAQTVLGDLMVLGAAMLWAAYTTLSKPLLIRHSPLKLTAVTMLAGTVPLVLLSTPQLLAQNWQAIPAPAWGSLAYSTLLAVVLAYILWYTSVQRVGNARTSIYSNLLPVVGIVVAWIFLGDRLAPLQAAGAVVVLAGIVLTRRGRVL